jgi:hypothetical protein
VERAECRGFSWRGVRGLAVLATLSLLASACGKREAGPSLAREDDDVVAIPDVPPPPADGPRLGALATTVPVFDRPSRRGKELGSLRAGATVARAATPFTRRGCDGGWYPIYPRGFVCAGVTATTDVAHPTLTAMSVQPNRDAALPYTYARAVKDTTLFAAAADGAGAEGDGRAKGAADEHDARVRPLAALRAKSTLAVVGSWTAKLPSGQAARLAMTTDGRFVPAADLEAVTPSAFAGTELGGDVALPLAFVVKRGVHAFEFRDAQPQKEAALDYHTRVALTGKRRVVGGAEFWGTKDGRFVRLTDVTLVRERHEFPEFAEGSHKWLDVSVVTGTLVAYQGRTPKFATLVSVGRDRLGAPGGDAMTRRGEFPVASKSLTFSAPGTNTDEAAVSNADVPWTLELSSGQRIVGAYWHDRFGIEHGEGDVEVSPADAATLFRFADPDVPLGWHTARLTAERPESGTIVNIRK